MAVYITSQTTAAESADSARVRRSVSCRIACLCAGPEKFAVTTACSSPRRKRSMCCPADPFANRSLSVKSTCISTNERIGSSLLAIAVSLSVV